MRVNRRLLREFKAFLGCCVCGERAPVALHFHHWGQDKVYNIASMRGMSHTKLYYELQKCSVMCRNCHAKCHGDVDAFAAIFQANAKRIAALIARYRVAILGGRTEPWFRLYARMVAFGDEELVFPPETQLQALLRDNERVQRVWSRYLEEAA